MNRAGHHIRTPEPNQLAAFHKKMANATWPRDRPRHRQPGTAERPAVAHPRAGAAGNAAIAAPIPIATDLPSLPPSHPPGNTPVYLPPTFLYTAPQYPEPTIPCRIPPKKRSAS
ncbi:hypothetical protein BVI434_1700019 [Burkholderia vietnamiensis]|nr:hypothetical protein BVI434_1700019 [Burkholderia vietnamiensis]